MKTSRATLELGKPTMREISEKLWPTSVYIMCIYEYESAAERPAGWIVKADSLGPFLKKKKN
jgi:hypothetical protein